MIEAGSLIRSLSGRPAARNFHTFVINEIGAGIVSGKFPVGSNLPTEAVMIETYQVSRSVLREALRTLEAKGMLEARPKVGTRIAPHSRWNLFDYQVLAWHFEAKLEPGFYESLFDIRMTLEARAADLASRRRNAEQVRLMKYWVHQMEVALDSVELHALADLEVHRIIAEASGNPLLRSVIGVVELTVALAAIAGTKEEQLSMRRASAAEHGRLVEAIEAGDSPAAVESMRRIVEAAHRSALGRFDAVASVDGRVERT